MTDLFGEVCPCCGQPVQNSAKTPFDEFWNVWPSKAAKEPARKAWSQLTPIEQRQAKDCAASWFSKWRKQNPEASPILASTYINQRRFLDMSETTPQVSSDQLEKMLKSRIPAVRDAARDIMKKRQLNGVF